MSPNECKQDTQSVECKVWPLVESKLASLGRVAQKKGVEGEREYLCDLNATRTTSPSPHHR